MMVYRVNASEVDESLAHGSPIFDDDIVEEEIKRHVERANADLEKRLATMLACWEARHSQAQPRRGNRQ